MRWVLAAKLRRSRALPTNQWCRAAEPQNARQQLGVIAVGCILNEQTVKTAIVRLSNRCLDAHFRRHTGEYECADSIDAQNVFELVA